MWYDYVTYNITQNLTEFIIVRHPFERLVSAYRDKLERMNLFYYNKYGRKIVQRFREKAIQTLGKDYFNKSNNYGTLLKADDRHGNMPSFWEFVQAVMIKLNMDEHWIPMHVHCFVCHPTQLKLHPYILKFENLSEEGPAFVNHMGWEGKINGSLQLNVNRSPEMSSQEITQLYFSVLSEDEIFKLYNVYKYDFILFDYKFDIGSISLPLDKIYEE